MNKIYLTKKEISDIEQLVQQISSQYNSVEDKNFLQNVSVFAHELPRRLRQFLNNFKLTESSPICLISGYRLDKIRLKKTPNHWKDNLEVSSVLLEEILFILYGSLLGEVFSWGTHLQEGKLIHDILPIKKYEDEQLSSSSKETLLWHTEDAHHPYRADYLGLMCLRNPDKVGTTFTSIDMLSLEPEHTQILFEPRFEVLPDKSHTKNNGFDALSESTSLCFDEAHNNTQKISILFGDFKSPYIRLDPLFMHPSSTDDEAQLAFNKLRQAIEDNLHEIILQPGDFCFIDNYRTVHGRKQFHARYDGNDRWLKRIFVTRDLRKSRGHRASTLSRIVF